MRYPASLPEGGTIGFIAPSFGCTTEPYKSAFEHALDTFQKYGFSIDLGPNCFADKGVGISNTPAACGREVNDYMLSPRNDCLISCGGGEMMCEILDYVDFDRITHAKPKWFMGYSDNTNLTFLLPTICDTAAIYGPCAPSFGMEPWHQVLFDAMDLLTGETREIRSYGMWESESLKDEEHPLQPYNTTEETILRCIPDENLKMRGRLIGGCLDCLVNLVGTGYDHAVEFAEKYKKDGLIWFFESCDLNVLDMRRALWHLEHAGWFRYVKGFIVGRPLHYGEEIMGLDQYSAVLSVLEKYHVPIILDADLGHLPPSMPLISGAKATVETKGNAIRVRFELS